MSPDIDENVLRGRGELLSILLIDRTRTTVRKTHNILWATEGYQGHEPTDEMKMAEITGVNAKVIQPRIMKTKEEQKRRAKEKAEVFTPRQIADEMNKQIDWQSGNWPATTENWQEYVKELKLEITCGEAPFIVGRYNAATGKKVLRLEERVGFLDRKLQQVMKFTETKEEFLEWATEAFRASYGYEWQGDNLLLARENLLYTFIDYWNEKWPEEEIKLEGEVELEKLEMLKKIAEVISWNLFQMDGLKLVVPMSCKNETKEELLPLERLWGGKPREKKVVCEGCRKNEKVKHNGVYAKIMDWEKNKVLKFVSLMKN